MRGGRPIHVKLHGAGELAPDASLLPRVCTLQWSPGSLPGYTWQDCAGRQPSPASMEPGITPKMQQEVLGHKLAVGHASMEPGITPRIHRLPRYSLTAPLLLQWSPGLLPGYTFAWLDHTTQRRTSNGPRHASQDTSRNVLLGRKAILASMEPGIIPGIHSLASRAVSSSKSLQWSPGSFPGYTGCGLCPSP